MIYGSVCSGVEAASVAWHGLGWNPAWFCEYDKFPSAVLDYRFPEVPNLGDMTKIENRKEYRERTINLLVGGTPCQSFSIAGLRKGLGDERGNLALEFCRILIQKRPRWFLWENVPGVLSSEGSRDFGTILRAMGECGYGFAYRVFNAQYFGVAQRRRRVFVVGYLGDWRPPAAVLFEQECLFGNPAPSRKTGAGFATDVAKCLTTGCGDRLNPSSENLIAGYTTSSFGKYVEGVGTLRAEGGDIGGGSETLIAYAPEVSPTLKAEGFDASEDGTGRQALIATKSFGIPGNWIGRSPENGGNATTPLNDLAPCLTVADRHGVVYGPDLECPVPIAIKPDITPKFQADLAFTLTLPSPSGGGHPQAVAVPRGLDFGAFKAGQGAKAGGIGYDNHVAPTLTAGASGTNNAPSIHDGMTVRKLTPIECERLQGFPDNWKLIPWRGKPAELCPDGPRYKAMGNSMAVPVMRWLGERIQYVDSIMGNGT